MSARASFIRDEPIALFLDVDGTLLEIAAKVAAENQKEHAVAS